MTDPKVVLEAADALQQVLNTMLETQKQVNDPYRCKVCGKQHAIWLEGPFSTGLYLCEFHLEEELTQGRGKR